MSLVQSLFMLYSSLKLLMSLQDNVELQRKEIAEQDCFDFQAGAIELLAAEHEMTNCNQKR